MNETMRAAVQRGAALLDQRVPGWRGRVDVLTLNMRSARLCVLGQLYGDYYDAVHVLNLGSSACEEHGFNSEWPTWNYEELTSLWIAEVQRDIVDPNERSEDPVLRDLELSGMSGLPGIVDGKLCTCSFINGSECEVTWDLAEVSDQQVARMAVVFAEELQRRLKS